MSIITILLIILICIVFQAFFAGSELALISADKLFLQKLADSGDKGAKTALEILAKPERVLATTLIGTNFAVVAAASFTSAFVFENYGNDHESTVVITLSILALIFGELMPKTICQRYAEKIAPSVSYPIWLFQTLFTPAILLLGKYTDWLSRKLRPMETLITGTSTPSHREELRYLLTHGQKETSLKTSERRMIRGIIDFARQETKKALIPLVRIDMLEDTCTIEEALVAFSKFKHSRLPIYKNRVDNVIGVLHLFDAYIEKDQKKSVSEIMRPAFYVPESQQLEPLLFTLQSRGVQIAIVVDEYGGAVGIVTLEDILEEIVGDIQDEYDSESAPYTELGEDEYLVQGQMEIDKLNELLKLALPKGDYETLAGFLLQQFNRIPEEGDELYFRDMKFIVRKATDRAIKKVYLQTKLGED